MTRSTVDGRVRVRKNPKSHAPTTAPSVAAATLMTMSTPSMPNSWYSGTVRASVSSAGAKTGASQSMMREAPSGRPRYIPMKTEGTARRTSGRSIVDGPSWICSQMDRT